MPTSAIADSFKTNVLNGKENFAGVSPATYKILLIKVGATGTYDKTLVNVGTPGTGSPSTTNVGTDEASGTGYTTGGVTLAGVSVSLQTDTATVDWGTNPSWTTATISAIAAVIYNSATSNVVAVISFGGTVTSTAGTFTITLPASGASTSMIRLA